MTRPGWDEFFLKIAELTSTRATCDRAHVGCVIVKNNKILTSGYNGSISGDYHCDDIGHMMVDNHCARTIHAEINAVIQAAKVGVSIEGAIAYLTHLPCWNCFKVLANAGIKRIVYVSVHGEHPETIEAASRLGISLEQKTKQTL